MPAFIVKTILIVLKQAMDFQSIVVEYDALFDENFTTAQVIPLPSKDKPDTH